MSKEWFEGRCADLTTDEAKEDRCVLRNRMIFWACVIGVVVGGSLLYAVKVWAEEIPVHVYEEQGLSMRLMPRPCTDVRSSMIVAMNLPQYADRFRAIDSVWPMQDGTRRNYAGCWAKFSAEEAGGTEVFVLVFEDGQHFVVPKDEFLRKRGQGGA